MLEAKLRNLVENDELAFSLLHHGWAQVCFWAIPVFLLPVIYLIVRKRKWDVRDVMAAWGCAFVVYSALLTLFAVLPKAAMRKAELVRGLAQNDGVCIRIDRDASRVALEARRPANTMSSSNGEHASTQVRGESTGRPILATILLPNIEAVNGVERVVGLNVSLPPCES